MTTAFTCKCCTLLWTDMTVDDRNSYHNETNPHPLNTIMLFSRSYLSNPFRSPELNTTPGVLGKTMFMCVCSLLLSEGSGRVFEPVVFVPLPDTASLGRPQNDATCLIHTLVHITNSQILICSTAHQPSNICLATLITSLIFGLEIDTHTPMYTHARIHTCTHALMQASTQAQDIFTHAYTHTHVHPHTHMYAPTHTHTSEEHQHHSAYLCVHRAQYLQIHKNSNIQNKMYPNSGATTSLRTHQMHSQCLVYWFTEHCMQTECKCI